MRTQVTPTEYRQIVEGIYRLSDSQRKKLFAEIRVIPEPVEVELTGRAATLQALKDIEDGNVIEYGSYDDYLKKTAKYA